MINFIKGILDFLVICKEDGVFKISINFCGELKIIGDVINFIVGMNL